MLTAHHTRTTEELLKLIRAQEARIAALTWNDELAMLSNAGLRDAVAALPEGIYTVVMCDIDRLKTINSATGSHTQTNRYLRDGLRVRRGEIAGQLYGDEFLFVLEDGADAPAFCARIGRQLAQQPLGHTERAMLEAIGGPGARLSATFATATGVADIWSAVELLSADVLAQKARRDARC